MDTPTTTMERAAASPAPLIDRAHLAHVTFGDRQLEIEVLELFERQSVLLMARMCVSAPSAVAGLAHTLKGSAASIGAGTVVRAAEAAELASARGAGECDLAVRQLGASVDEVRAAIRELTRTP